MLWDNLPYWKDASLLPPARTAHLRGKQGCWFLQHCKCMFQTKQCLGWENEAFFGVGTVAPVSCDCEECHTCFFCPCGQEMTHLPVS